MNKQKEVASFFLREFFSRPDEIKNLCHENVILYWREEALIHGLDALVEFGWQQKRIFPDINLVIKDILSDGNLAAVRLQQQGVLAQTWEGCSRVGEKFVASEAMFFEFSDNLIVRISPVLDMEEKKQTLK